jgi:hypothetical protein
MVIVAIPDASDALTETLTFPFAGNLVPLAGATIITTGAVTSSTIGFETVTETGVETP